MKVFDDARKNQFIGVFASTAYNVFTKNSKHLMWPMILTQPKG